MRDDECVEVTPDAVRLRKVILTAQERATSRNRSAKAKARSDAVELVD